MSWAQGHYPQDLLNSYSSSGFGSSSEGLPFGEKQVLIVIDVCDAYLTPGSPLYAPDRFHDALTNIERLIQVFRMRCKPIIFTRVIFQNLDSGGNWYKQKIPKALKCFDAGNNLGDFPAQSVICRPRPGETVIEKQFSSSFFGTPLASILLGLKVDTIVICGYSTSGCVRATTTDAMQYGFSPFVAGDACGDRHAYPHEANLFDIQAKFGEVMSTDEILEHLAGEGWPWTLEERTG